MAQEKLTGFVLSSHPLSASRSVVALFTRTGGKRQGVMRLTKAQPAAYLSPLACLSFQLTGKEHQELMRISQLSLESHCFQAAAAYPGLALLQHWANLVARSQPEAHEDERVFRLLDHCLASVRANADPRLGPARNVYFETWLLHFCGVAPRGGGDDGESTHNDEALWRAIDPALTAAVFRHKLDAFAAGAPPPAALTAPLEALDEIWTHFLGKPLRTRPPLIAQFQTLIRQAGNHRAAPVPASEGDRA